MKAMLILLYGAICHYSFTHFPPGLAILLSVTSILLGVLVYLGIGLVENEQ